MKNHPCKLGEKMFGEQIEYTKHEPPKKSNCGREGEGRQMDTRHQHCRWKRAFRIYFRQKLQCATKKAAQVYRWVLLNSKQTPKNKNNRINWTLDPNLFRLEKSSNYYFHQEKIWIRNSNLVLLVAFRRIWIRVHSQHALSSLCIFSWQISWQVVLQLCHHPLQICWVHLFIQHLI